MVGELFMATWVSILFIAAHALIACRNKMREMGKLGFSIDANNRILIRWLLSVFVPFFVFVMLLAGWKQLGTWMLAGVMTVKAGIDVFVFRRDQARIHHERTAARA